MSVHTLIYSDDASATRALLRDVLSLPFVKDASSEPGWQIFGTGPSGDGRPCHPQRLEGQGAHDPYFTWLVRGAQLTIASA